MGSVQSRRYKRGGGERARLRALPFNTLFSGTVLGCVVVRSVFSGDKLCPLQLPPSLFAMHRLQHIPKVAGAVSTPPGTWRAAARSLCNPWNAWRRPGRWASHRIALACRGSSMGSWRCGWQRLGPHCALAVKAVEGGLRGAPLRFTRKRGRTNRSLGGMRSPRGRRTMEAHPAEVVDSMAACCCGSTLDKHGAGRPRRPRNLLAWAGRAMAYGRLRAKRGRRRVGTTTKPTFTTGTALAFEQFALLCQCLGSPQSFFVGLSFAHSLGSLSVKVFK